MHDLKKLIKSMIAYYSGDPKRVQHFIKVYTFAKLIGESEGLNSEMQQIVEIAALVHDIGIKVSEEKYQSSAGKYQELEGPPLAQKTLAELQYRQPLVARVCWLVGHHHSYNDIRELDHQILVEADWLVNACEDGLSRPAIRRVDERIFKTKTGKWLLETMFLKC